MIRQLLVGLGGAALVGVGLALGVGGWDVEVSTVASGWLLVGAGAGALTWAVGAS